MGTPQAAWPEAGGLLPARELSHAATRNAAPRTPEVCRYGNAGVNSKRGGVMADIDRHELHTLVDHIPESDVPAARKVLRALADQVELAILTAPLDDEPETEEERASVASSLADPSSDIPFEQLRRIRA